ncbi:MAG: peptidoglycan DD-metalloendopeptidase family protein, partial [Rikenellaceae bacterium]
MSKKKLLWLLLLALTISGIIVGIMLSSNEKTEEEDIILNDIRKELCGINIDSMKVDSGVVRRGETLSTILEQYNLSRSEIYELTKASKGVFDVKDLKVGQPYMILTPLRDSTGGPSHFIYGVDKINFIIFNRQANISVDKYQKAVTVTRKNAIGEIKGSFWNTVVGMGLGYEFVMKVSNIYQWTVDFYGIGAGDGFNIIYDEQSVDGEVVGIGDIYGAWFDHNGKRYYAIHYHDAKHNGFWDETGASLKKAFLKAPLRYSRISSTYTNSRFHPVLRIYRPHHGVDYAAPTGTPVEAVADGVITYRAYSGGGGNTLKIRHSMQGGKYVTGYMHLSRFASGITVGRKVRQGDVIVFVGSTGHATGPHLDYRI